ncbi:MAG TPA: 2'-5' RNA ligase family protein [Polyangiaceae bacterium]|nr:2'-5' RNA ligase family protein [Polyangiaceae bacterium]
MGPNWFIGLAIAAPGLRERLEGAPAVVSLLHPDDLHLTLAFLGDVGEARARLAWAERGRLAPLGAAARFDFGSVVGLGNRRRPSALSARPGSGEAELGAAIASVREAMQGVAGAERERRPPLPHITIARVRRAASDAEHAEALAWARGLDLRGVGAVVARVALYSAGDAPGGRRYRDVEREALAAE